MKLYALEDVFNIVFLVLNNDAITANLVRPLKSVKLIDDYLLVTSKQVAQSCEWYRTYTHDNDQLHNDLSLLLSYFSKNVESQVLHRVNQILKEGFSVIQNGGPLFLKLLISEITVTNDSTRANIVVLIKLYKIKNKHPGEDIKEVVSYLHPIINTLHTICKGSLPEKFVDDFTTIFITTSFDNFNNLFKTLKQSVTATSISTLINSGQQVGGSLTLTIKNNLQGCRYVLEHVLICYKYHTSDRTWVNIPKESNFLNSSTVVDPVPSTKPFKNNYFNCLNVKGCTNIKHSVKQCPFPLDSECICLNREAYFAAKKKKQAKYKGNDTTPAPPTQPNNAHKRAVPHKWRPPEDKEQMQCIINPVSMSWNPNTNWWDKVVTPNSGIPPSVNVAPPPSITFNPPSLASTDYTSPSTASYVSQVAPPELNKSHAEKQRRLYRNLMIMKKEYDAGRWWLWYSVCFVWILFWSTISVIDYKCAH